MENTVEQSFYGFAVQKKSWAERDSRDEAHENDQDSLGGTTGKSRPFNSAIARLRTLSHRDGS